MSKFPLHSASLLIAITLLLDGPSLAAEPPAPSTQPRMQKIRIADDGKHFILADSGERFIPWGFNYLGQFGSLVEESWATDWPRLERDFADMHKLGANVVRVHLQFSTYMNSATETNAAELERLRKMLDLARANYLYLDITGLSCYRLAKVPAWYDALGEADRWQAQANFWEAIAKTCAEHPAVFCYDLMNEPVIGGPPKPGEPRWLAGELGGFHFVQRLSIEPNEKRSNIQIAEARVSKLTTTIRKQDPHTPITVGVIPWAQIWPSAKPVFYSPEAGKHLDFVSIHMYPKKGEVAKAITAIGVYDIGKPIVIEETFPLNCLMDEFEQFIDQSTAHADGWIGHYFGKSIEEYRSGTETNGPIIASLLEYWRDKTKSILATPARR